MNQSRTPTLIELIVCSLEPWDEVWRRNQFFTDKLLRRNPSLRVLFVEPVADPLYDVMARRRPTLPRLRSISADRRLRVFRPIKPLPRKVGGFVDNLVCRQVSWMTSHLRFTRPTLWLNDVTYAPLIARTGWASVYDVTDDWLLAPFSQRELSRLERLDRVALDQSNEVVVCSPALALSRGEHRGVSLIPNGVDVEHFRRSRARPHDLPAGPVAVYMGTLHESRLDVALVSELAQQLPQVSVALVGPDSLGHASHELLDRLANVFVLGEKPYEGVPAYLQHADVIIVPHHVSPFTESLDPIKAYECLVVDTPTVATPVAGFREHRDHFILATRERFADCVDLAIREPPTPSQTNEVPSWDERAQAFEDVLRRAGDNAVGPIAPST